MNKLILHTGVQLFINENWDTDTLSVLLQKPLFDGISQKELVEQLEAKKKCKDKLPTWFTTPNIYYPNKLNIEQTSSEQTARYKAGLVDGKNLLDLTGGFGVDAYFFSKKIEKVFHCEINTELSEIATYNFGVLGQENITCVPEDGIHYLQNNSQKYDWIFVDPSRRNENIGKVFLLKDCLPNIPEQLPLLFNHTQKVLIKVSPILDLTQGLEELSFVKEVHVVAVNNEVKELLYLLEQHHTGDVMIKTINFTHDREVVFDFVLNEEKVSSTKLGSPQRFLYEPNAAILKSGGFKIVGEKYGLQKLHQHSHLYTSETLVEFPGRRFSIVQVLPYSKKTLRSFSQTKANVTTRNFPLSVAEIRKKHKIKDGGDRYLFFTKNHDDSLLVLDCSKVLD
ncbi:class I SAM-dependent methyltransferase [Flagellimonas olearia]|uniref:Class I SAM-dependent methyltransferase n=1 Tax=Flagellimonas olearia TaxID=552546 RepID=A0A6I1E009_9FLAO|nr:class I SAM-dependent methyltransferase [Allomuricauda olearia]KAB7530457.1 class I SAM-dependent methyltransferase [Allomuricauda olearia]